MSDKGLTLWFTGLSGSGKSTLAQYLTPRLRRMGNKVEVLDGDEIRENLSKGLGFSKEDRDTNIRRIGYVANMLARNGVVAITAAISPYRELRREMRSKAQAPFVDALAQVRVSPSRHALDGPFVAKPMVAIAFSAARDHDAIGIMASQGKVDE